MIYKQPLDETAQKLCKRNKLLIYLSDIKEMFNGDTRKDFPAFCTVGIIEAVVWF
jgi:uridylate kinase